MNSKLGPKEAGLAINKALFDKNSDVLIRLISDFMRQNDMKATKEIVQNLPVLDDEVS